MNENRYRPRRLTLLHADTPGRMNEFDLPCSSPDLAVRLTALSEYDRFRVVSAVWCRKGRTDDECRADLFRTVLTFRRSCAAAGILPDRVPLSVEDLRLIGNDPAFLDALAALGAVSVIPFWRGENALGGGWDTDAGLTPLGRAAIGRCFDLGLIPDISHASRRSADEILSMGEARARPVIASHVGFDRLCGHGRNLTDEAAGRIADLGGAIGITFHAPHLSRNGDASLSDAVSHLLYGYEKYPRAIALGSDFDGTDLPARGLCSTDDLPALSDALFDAGLDRAAVDAIFYENADRLLCRNGKTSSIFPK